MRIRLYVTPPSQSVLDQLRFDRLSKLWRENPRSILLSECHERFRRLIPPMQREIECRPVNRQKRSTTKHLECAQRVDWSEVNVRPCRIGCADFYQRQIERSE